MQAKNKRELWLHVRVNADEKQHIEDNAGLYKLDTADYLRRLGEGGFNPFEIREPSSSMGFLNYEVRGADMTNIPPKKQPNRERPPHQKTSE